jgi:hypothetical protein
MARHSFVVQTNAEAGREREYNDWYTNAHVPDALTVPGLVSARRFKISGTQRQHAAPYSYEYLTIYEMEGDPGEALAALAAAVPGMSISSAIAEDRQLHVFEALTDRVCPVARS